METRVGKLKNDFNNLINIRNNVKNIFDILQSRIDELKQLYSEFIHNNKNQMFVFGLDSFHFQSKLIDIEYDDMKRLFLAINNRMYCEYFKLNKIIIEYILNNITDKKIIDIFKANVFPIYKDLEPFKEYKFENLMSVHENILKMISVLITELNIKENELTIYKTKQCIGLNIDNFVTTFNYNNNVMKEKILMFTTYIEFFHKLHTKYLKRFSNKIQLVYKDINSDINFDKSEELNKKDNSITNSITNSISNEHKIYISTSDNDLNETSRKNTISESVDTISTKSSNFSKLNSSETINDIVNNDNTENISLKLSNNEIYKSVSNEEVNELFFNIESSFNSIINKKENENVINIQVIKNNVDSIENNDNTYNIESKEEIIHEELSINKIIESSNTTEIEKEVERKKKSVYKPIKKKG